MLAVLLFERDEWIYAAGFSALNASSGTKPPVWRMRAIVE